MTRNCIVACILAGVALAPMKAVHGEIIGFIMEGFITRANDPAGFYPDIQVGDPYSYEYTFGVDRPVDLDSDPNVGRYEKFVANVTAIHRKKDPTTGEIDITTTVTAADLSTTAFIEVSKPDPLEEDLLIDSFSLVSTEFIDLPERVAFQGLSLSYLATRSEFSDPRYTDAIRSWNRAMAENLFTGTMSSGDFEVSLFGGGEGQAPASDEQLLLADEQFFEIVGNVTKITPIPEPSSLTLAALALLGLSVRRRRRPT